MSEDLVRVEWYDAEGKDEWESREDAQDWFSEPSLLAVTYGLLTFESDSHIVVTQTQTPDLLMHSLKIPRGCIKQIEKLDG